MTTLQAITENLRALLRPESERPSRPLLCRGSPIGCEAAIVGINPGTDTPFWEFWNAESGCDKEAWLATFRSNRRNANNQTRRRIEWLVEELHPVRCLELNLYPYFSRGEPDLPKEFKDVRVFDYLLRTIKPKLLFAFGDPPIKELRKRLNVPALPRGAYTSCCYDGARFEVYTDTHLSRGWSQDRARALGREFRNRIIAQRG